MTEPVPRIAPLAPEERTADDRRELAKFAGTRRSEYNIFTTLAKHRAAFPAVLDLTQRLIAAGGLTVRDREIVILRAGSVCGSAYEWSQHVGLGRDAGIDEPLLKAIAGGPLDEVDPPDRQLIDAVDELLAAKTLSEPSWLALRKRFDETQTIELILLVGHYHLLALFLNSLHVVPDGPN